ncbi:MAG: hypothetical protein JSS60_08325 [Verrucomicrobia bacterium]|nr:hypothetical protein [Verrucomicrobiota bacterium]
MLKDEFNRLIALFHEAAEGKTIDLEEVFKQSLDFFGHLKEQILSGTPEDKQEAMRMMSELYNQMMVESKKITERSGMTEEQLVAYAENPANFSKEQWSSIQASKEKIVRAGRDLAKTVESSAKGAPVNAAEGKAEKKHSTEKKGKKSQWMRS